MANCRKRNFTHSGTLYETYNQKLQERTRKKCKYIWNIASLDNHTKQQIGLTVLEYCKLLTKMCNFNIIQLSLICMHSILFISIQGHHSTSLHSILLHSTPFFSIPFHSTPFYFILLSFQPISIHNMPFHSIPFHSTQFHSVVLHSISLDSTLSNSIPLHFLNSISFHSIVLHFIPSHFHFSRF